MVATAKNELKVTLISDREAELTRVFNAPREVVFKTMMDPALIPQWWGPRRYTTAVDKMDVRVGGKWRFVNRDKTDGSEHWFNGEYREIVPNERVVQTFEYEPFPGESVETMTLEDLGGSRTLVRVRAVYPSKEAADAMVKGGMEEGARETYDRLEEVIATQKRAA